VSELISSCQWTTQIVIPTSGLSQDVEVVSAFYVASLRDLVGEAYHGPSLSFLAIAWVRYPGTHPDPSYRQNLIPFGRRVQGTGEAIIQRRARSFYGPRDSGIGRVVAAQTWVFSAIGFNKG